MSDHSGPHRLPAGVTLKAVEAAGGQQTFDRAQVAYLIHLAFLSGAEHRRLFDAADLAATWEDNTAPRVTHEMRVAAEMRLYAERDELRKLREAGRRPVRMRPGQRYGWDERQREVPVGESVEPDIEWPAVAVPGGGA
jgi:hypothetical protein